MDSAEIHRLMVFEKLSDEQIEWLAGNSNEVTFEANKWFIQEGAPATALYCLFEGEWRLSRLIGGHETTLVKTSQPGSWFGGLPIVDGTYQSSAETLQPSRFLEVPNEAVRYMLNNGFPIMQHLMNGITIGARNVEGLIRQQEKMAALGKLSAGLAHELNNPAAANRRAASQMRETLQTIQGDALKLAQLFNPDQLTRLAELQKEASARAKNPPTLDSLAQSEAEDTLNGWLDDHNVAEGWRIAPTLVEAGLDQDWLERLAEFIPDEEELSVALNWLEASLTGASLLNQLEQSAERISGLVKAIKEYSYMDQAPIQELDIHEGLESTLTIMQHKLKHGVTVHREYDHSLPKINAYGSELNQVWTNLIDNAVDAMDGQGDLWLRTWRDGECIVVEIADNGPGVPAEIQSRIFEPFFTTKGVGEGTGLGLDVAYRVIVNRHKGELKLVSQPGDTRFQSYLPVAGPGK